MRDSMAQLRTSTTHQFMLAGESRTLVLLATLGLCAAVIAVGVFVALGKDTLVVVAVAGVGLLVLSATRPWLVFLGFVAMNGLFTWIPSLSYIDRDRGIGLPYAISGIPLYTTDWILAALMGTVLLQRFRSRERQSMFGSSNIGVFFLGLLIVALVSAGWGWLRGNESYLIRADVRPFLYAVSVFFLGSYLISDLPRLKQLWGVLLSCAAIKGVEGLFLVLTGFQGRLTNEGFARIFVDTFVHQVLFFGLVSIIGLLLYVRWRGIGSRALLVLVLMAVLYSLVISYSRAVWTIMLVLPLLLLILLREDWYRLPVLIAIVGLLPLLIASELNLFQFSGIWEHYSRLRDAAGDFSVSYRLAEYPVVLRDIRGSLVLGFGMGGTYSGYLALSGFGSRVNPGSVVHNLFLYVLLKTGLTGLLIFIFLLSQLLRLAWSNLQKVTSPWSRALSFGLIVSLLIFLALGQSGALINHQGDSIFLGLIAAMVVCMNEHTASLVAVTETQRPNWRGQSP